MEHQLILQKLGLTEKQSVVYNALLELGSGQMTQVAKRASLKRPTVYLIIDELQLLGLVSEIKKGKKKVYSAVHPKRIGEILDFRKNQFNDVLPELTAKYGSVSGKPKVQMLEGIEGIRQAYKEAFDVLFQEEVEGLWMGNIGFLSKKFPEVVQEYNRVLKNLKEYKIREIIFGGIKSKEWVDSVSKNKRPYHQVKYLDDKNKAGLTDQFIIKDRIYIFSMSDTEIFTLIIESAEMAKTQRFVFDSVWSASI
ncbi:MAG: hypothetical protein K9M11_02990 [Candidatus Pacebacteria bacterium]|nr:hypothetical protein [Candidatus Paceibacterota bacterium]